MTPAETRILNSFWHKGRKEFVPLTHDEVHRRSDVPKMSVAGMLRNLKSEGLMSSMHGERGEITTYELTETAKRIVFGSILG